MQIAEFLQYFEKLNQESNHNKTKTNAHSTRVQSKWNGQM